MERIRNPKALTGWFLPALVECILGLVFIAGYAPIVALTAKGMGSWTLSLIPTDSE